MVHNNPEAEAHARNGSRIEGHMQKLEQGGEEASDAKYLKQILETVVDEMGKTNKAVEELKAHMVAQKSDISAKDLLMQGFSKQFEEAIVQLENAMAQDIHVGEQMPEGAVSSDTCLALFAQAKGAVDQLVAMGKMSEEESEKAKGRIFQLRQVYELKPRISGSQTSSEKAA